MYVLKRPNTDGGESRREKVNLEKITKRIQLLCRGLHPRVDYNRVAIKVCAEMKQDIRTTEIDELSVEVAKSFALFHPDYLILAGRIAISNLDKNMKLTFSQNVKFLFEFQHPLTKKHHPLVHEPFHRFVQKHSAFLDDLCGSELHRCNIGILGLSALIKSYLVRVPTLQWSGKDGKNDIVYQTHETPVYLFMRVAVAIHMDSDQPLVDIKKHFLYRLDNAITHASPTLFNAGLDNRKSESVLFRECEDGKALPGDDREMVLTVRHADKAVGSARVRPSDLSLRTYESVMESDGDREKRERMHSQLSSCYLLRLKDDSIGGIYNTLKDCAVISKHGGGVGISISDIRATGSFISGTNGISNGILPMLKVFNQTAAYVDQGGGKRKGAFAIYMEPWHADIEDFLHMRDGQQPIDKQVLGLFTALMVPDIFMAQVHNDGDWWLMCPNECPGLTDLYGAEFTLKYLDYVKQGRYRKRMKAMELFSLIERVQIETGSPFVLYKHACNFTSNQKALGTITNSNLCTEIIEYSDGKDVAVCNLATVSLTSCVKGAQEVAVEEKRTWNGRTREDSRLFGPEYDDRPDDIKALRPDEFSFQKLYELTYWLTISLNRVLDHGWSPVEGARRSNSKQRPVGIGVQGLQDVFFMLRCPFDSKLAMAISRKISETMYFASLRASCDLAKKTGRHYDGFRESPLSRGIFHFELYKEFLKGNDDRHRFISNLDGTQTLSLPNVPSSCILKSMPDLCTPSDNRHDWSQLREDVVRYGVMNSLLIALPPTATTSRMLNNYECFDPQHSNNFVCNTLSGSFHFPNRYLYRDLESLGLLDSNGKTISTLKTMNWSVQGFGSLPTYFRKIYRNVFEIPGKSLATMAIHRGVFIDQSSSNSYYNAHPTGSQLGSYLMFMWTNGVKTGMYYLRSQSTTMAKGTRETSDARSTTESGDGQAYCDRNDKDCLSCSS